MCIIKGTRAILSLIKKSSNGTKDTRLRHDNNQGNRVTPELREEVYYGTVVQNVGEDYTTPTLSMPSFILYDVISTYE